MDSSKIDGIFRAVEDGEEVVICRDGQPVAVILDWYDYRDALVKIEGPHG